MDGFIQEQEIQTRKVRVWHVLEYDHFEIEEHSYGQFHEGDTYVIRWQYMIVNAGRLIVFVVHIVFQNFFSCCLMED